MKERYYVGLDVHKKTISYCVKTADGMIEQEGMIPARREALLQWVQQMPGPWVGALEATLFSEWIYDFVSPWAEELKVGHPARMKAITAGKRKTDQLDARQIADLVRCNLLAESYMLPRPVRELRRVLRYRNLLVGQSVKMKNRISGLLMETGTEFQVRRLHGQRYFQKLLSDLEEVPDSVVHLLGLSRQALQMLQKMERDLLRGLLEHPQLHGRVQLLRTIPAVGQVTALTWSLEVGDVSRFGSIKQAVSYCGLCSAQRQSAGKDQRGPLSKQRNKHLQRILVEAAKLAPRYNDQLAWVYQQQRQGTNHNRATLAVARKLVAYLMAVDRSGRPFEVRTKLS